MSQDACVDYARFMPTLKRIRVHIWRTNLVLVLSFIVVVILVGAGTFSRRYRRNGWVRLLSLGAYTLFLPLVSYAVSGVDKESCILQDGIQCYDNSSPFMFVCASIVQTVGTNYCTSIPAHDDERRNIGPTVQLLLGAILILFLVVKDFMGYLYIDNNIVRGLILIPCVLNLAKILAKLYACKKAWRSFEFGGRNARLIAGYMEQLNLLPGDEHATPLILTGEDKQKVKEGPHCHRFTDGSAHRTLVTINRVINMTSSGDIVLNSWPPLNDLCLSFSLFKLLRQRFTRYPVVEAYRSVPNFMIKLQYGDPQGTVSMIADELSFARDFYYTYLPISYSSWWLPILNVVLSFFVIIYGFAGVIYMLERKLNWPMDNAQMFCSFNCDYKEYVAPVELLFGSNLSLAVMTILISVPVFLSESWEIISYTCSKWTKVNLICGYITKTSWHGSPRLQRLICFLLRFRCKILNNSYEMGQTSIMDLDTNTRIVKAFLCLPRLPHQIKYVKIPAEVNTAILNKFRASNWSLPTVSASVQQSPIGNNILWACNGKGISDVILVWHIATCIFEINHPDKPSPGPAASEARITATHLSRYCAYLLSAVPELLPDDKAWSKKLYKSVKKITEPIFSRSDERSMEYEHILQQLAENSNGNAELDGGVRLGRQLVDETQGSEQEGWKIMAGFWSAMMLNIAPSDNAAAHRKAIARGGELITILWAMLTHAGIISRPRGAVV
uniref:DUF4220 domain-containing protein n=1 Tax=Leersia perrieri TaxID=77586 RepID=A0A0D9V0L6_9ORYZ